ncbi:hypothetical protein D3C74_316760 [compost metagenome]
MLGVREQDCPARVDEDLLARLPQRAPDPVASVRGSDLHGQLAQVRVAAGRQGDGQVAEHVLRPRGLGCVRADGDDALLGRVLLAVHPGEDVTRLVGEVVVAVGLGRDLGLDLGDAEVGPGVGGVEARGVRGLEDATGRRRLGGGAHGPSVLRGVGAVHGISRGVSASPDGPARRGAGPSGVVRCAAGSR